MKWKKEILNALLQPLMEDAPQYSSYARIFQFLTGHDFLKQGQQVHAHMVIRRIEPDDFLGSRMVAMYASSGDLGSAVALFDRIADSSSRMFNSMIRAFTLYGFFRRTVSIYFQMHSLGLRGDYFTFPFVLKSCAELSHVELGKCVHGLSLRSGLEFDAYVGTSLIDMYVKCGAFSDACGLFDKMPLRDVASWNALIAGHMKVGMVSDAEDLFRKMPDKNIVSWTAMISGYTQNGLTNQALGLFDEMLKEQSNVKPNWVTVMSILPCCAHPAALDRGRRIHKFITESGLASNSDVHAALAAMYAKCGSLTDAQYCFDRIRPNEKKLVAWNTMITAYASHGYGLEAVSAFEEMIRTGVRPDEITFTSLLSGCSHSGLVDIGLKYFDSMTRVYFVEPKHEHYACVVDLLGRAGRLVEAHNLIYQMPMRAGASIWGSLLAASQIQKNLEIAEIAGRKLFVLEPYNSGNYLLLSNMYAEAGMWEEVNNLRSQLKLLGVKKIPGCSWIEFNGKAHLFLGGDMSHPQSEEIYMLLEALIEAASYVPGSSFVLGGISESENEHI